MAAQTSTVNACALVMGNFAVGHGGGIASIGEASLVFGQGTALRGNSAGDNGGCVYAAGSSAVFGEQDLESVLVKYSIRLQRT